MSDKTPTYKLNEDDVIVHRDLVKAVLRVMDKYVVRRGIDIQDLKVVSSIVFSLEEKVYPPNQKPQFTDK